MVTVAGALLPERGPLPGRRPRHPPAGARALGRRGRRGALRRQGGRAWHDTGHIASAIICHLSTISVTTACIKHAL